MPIDTTALRKFQEVFTPILEIIPAVLAAEAGKRDLEREIVLKKAERAKADKDIAKAFDEADKRLSAVNSEMEKAIQEKAKALADIEAANNAAAVERDKAEKAQAKVFDEWNKKVAEMQSKFANVETEYAKKVSAAEAVYAAKVASMEAEVKELEKRQATAEKALDALRSKLG